MFWLAVPQVGESALIWRRGEGWSWEHGATANVNNPKDMLDLAKKFQAAKQYDDAVSAYRRLIARWPTSFAAQDARLGLAESLTGLGYLYKSFKEYQNLIEKNPGSPYFDLVLQRQFDIGTAFMNGAKNKIWRFRLFTAYDKGVEVFEQVVKNGPFSKVGPEAQYRIGLTYEKQEDYLSAVHAYEKILDRYPNQPIAEKAQFEIGWAYRQEAQRADYDQSNANLAIGAFSDFLVKYPGSSKAEEAQKLRSELKGEQSHGYLQIAAYYEKNKNYRAALIYYNQVIEENPRSDWANTAQQKLTMIVPLAKQQPVVK